MKVRWFWVICSREKGRLPVPNAANLISEQDSVTRVYQTIKTIIEEARNISYQTVKFTMVNAYREIGRTIVEEEQRGKARADYGSYLIKELSKKLSQNLGKGFDISNLKNMRQLSRTHYRLTLKLAGH